MRKFAPRKSVSTGMANTASTDPFEMRIPSPDPSLTGQVLAKEIPDDPNRTSSIYADQFLAHKCPPNFDEIQRRQFFCILDLRRLKFAADEIFAKKDWKLNILNFAKEYEKSRGLIMLRYGLYEFKNVKPSNEVLKKWRSAHGLPPDPEEDHSLSHSNRRTPGPPGATKRKAEEELPPKDTALTTSTANQNKRRNLAQEVDNPILAAPAPFKKSKRKADETEELTENKPSKQQKSTPSAATSLFESILNKPSNGGASPSKQTSQTPSLFGVSKPKDSQDAQFATKPNPFKSTSSSLLFGAAKTNNTSTPSGSIFSGHQIGSTPTANTGNIFSYLSESPNSSGNENDNDDDDRDTDSEPEQGPSAAASTNTNTPAVQTGSSPFVTSKTSNTSDIFGSLSRPANQAAKGGLFGRVQMGANGQPMRASPSLDEKPDSSATQPSAAKEQRAETPAKPPGDYTFNPATTPISFGQPALDVSKSFSTTDTGPSAKSSISEPKKAVSIFGASSQTSSGPKLSAPGLFGASSSTKPQLSEKPVSIFALPPSASPSIFGAAATAPAAKLPPKVDEQTNEASSAAKKQAVSIFDKPATSFSTTSDTKSPPNNGEDKSVSSIPVTRSQAPSIFDKSFIAKNAAQAKTLSETSKPSTDLFSRSSNPLFGAAKDNQADTADNKTEAANTKADADTSSSKKQAPSIFDKSFIANNAAQAKAVSDTSKPSTDLFSRSSNPLFGAPKANGTTSTSTKSNFDQGEKNVSSNLTSTKGSLQTLSDNSKEIGSSSLGLKAATPTPAAVSIFGTPASSKPAAPTPSVFGEKKQEESTKLASSIFNSTPAASGSIFGLAAQPNANTNKQTPSMIFGANATPSSSISFGASSSQANGPGPKKLGFQFGSSTPSAGGSSSSFTFGQSSSSGSGFTFTAGGDKEAIKNPFATSQPSTQPSAPVFGGNSSTTTPSSSFNVSFGQQPSSTPKAAPSSQSGGLFGSSTNTNGAPTFSFTQASPGQNLSGIGFSKPSAPLSPFGHLQASEGSTFAGKLLPCHR